MAAEAAEAPSPLPPRTGAAEAPAAAPGPGKRALADRDREEKEQEGVERPEPESEPKRRRARARIAALDSVPRASEVAAAAAATASREDESVGGCDGAESSFSFHARSFSSAQTTPKFGSFNPGATATATAAAAAELVAFHLMKASRRRVGSSATDEAGEHRKVDGGGEVAAAEGTDENSR